MKDKHLIWLFLLSSCGAVVIFLVFGILFERYDMHRNFKIEIGAYTEQQQIDLYRGKYIGYCTAINEFLTQATTLSAGINLAVAKTDEDFNKIYAGTELKTNLKTLASTKISDINSKIVKTITVEEKQRVEQVLIDAFLKSSTSLRAATQFGSEIVSEKEECIIYTNDALQKLDMQVKYYKKNKFSF
jgi:hypothetical protein